MYSQSQTVDCLCIILFITGLVIITAVKYTDHNNERVGNISTCVKCRCDKHFISYYNLISVLLLFSIVSVTLANAVVFVVMVILFC